MSEISRISSTTELQPTTKSGRIDPYAVFQLNFEALGGEKYVKYDKSFKYKGELQIGDSNFDLEEYVKFPNKNLRRILSNYKLIYRNGDDGINIWNEQDGQIYTFNDADSPEREIKKLWEEYDYTNQQSRVFSATATNKKVLVDGDYCYEIKIKNRKTDEVVTQYYDSESYLLKREKKETSDSSSQTDYSDYKAVGNILMAHKKNYINLMTGEKQTTIYDKIEKGIYISDTKFFCPEEKDGNKVDLSAILNKGNNVDAYV